MMEVFFHFEFEVDASIEGPTVLYIPKINYPNGYDINLSNCEIQKDEKNQSVSIFIKKNGLYQVKITKI